MSISRVFKSGPSIVYGLLQGCFKGVLRVFQGYFKGVSQMFHRYFKGMYICGL